MKTIHIITGLGQGGTEQMLCKLLERTDQERCAVQVVSLSGDGPAGKRLRRAGVKVTCLNLTAGGRNWREIARLWSLLHSEQPDVVQTWLYHADLIGGVCAKLAGVRHVCWNIRNTNLDVDKTRWHTRQVVRLCAILSHWLPSVILSNSQQAALAHQQRGYGARRFRIIPNGFDVEHFRRDAERGKQLRQKWGLPAQALVLGHIGRFDPQKNHVGLFRAFAQVLELVPATHLLCCGMGVDSHNSALTYELQRLSLEEQVHLLGPQKDVSCLLNACDLFVLPSHGEAFPNVLGEAMACEVPCVVTAVGDCREIVGESGWAVPPGDEAALVAALQKALLTSDHDRQLLGNAARRRIIENYELQQIVNRYSELYQSMRKN